MAESNTNLESIALPTPTSDLMTKATRHQRSTNQTRQTTVVEYGKNQIQIQKAINFEQFRTNTTNNNKTSFKKIYFPFSL